MTIKLQHIIFTRKQLQDRKTFYNIRQHLKERWAFVFVAAEKKEDTENEMDNETLDEVAKFPVTSMCRTAAA
jgi:mannose/fructose/N-acetylgalactosamine-specific phosphotransferase system component IID